MGLFDQILGSDKQERSLRLAGIGDVLMGMDVGRSADVSPYIDAIQQRQKQGQMQTALQDPSMLERFSDEERKYLASMPVEVAAPLIQERLFAKADPWANMKVVGDKVISAGANGLQVMGDFGSPEKPPSLQHVTDAGGAIRTFNPQTGELSAPLTDGKQATGARPLVDPQERAAWGIPEADTRPYAIEEGKPPALVGDSKGVTIHNDMGGDKFNEAWAKNDADTVGSISETGMAAMRNIPRIDQLDALLASNPTGGMAALKVALGDWGVATEGLDELQTARAAISAMVPEQRTPGSGPMSDSDLELFKQSLPRIINQPGGNRLIVDTLRAIAQYDAEGARIVQEGRAGGLNRAQIFDKLQKRENPLGKFVAPSQARQDQTEKAWQDIGGVKIRRKD